jgi:hypothetical protein
MDRKLYNGGDRLVERMLYSIKTEAAKDGHSWNAHKNIDAPAHSFFTIADEVPAPQQGVPRVPTYFHVDIAQKHGHRGIVLIDAELATDVDDDTPFARNEEDAQEKGERLWHNHLVNTVQRHLDYCADARAAGGAPKAASAFTRHAFKLLGVVDPATTIFEQSIIRSAKPAERTAPATDAKADKDKEIQKLRGQLLAANNKARKLEAEKEAQAKLQRDEAINAKRAELQGTTE